MTNGIVVRCCVCKTIELGKDVLIPDGSYQLVNQDFSDIILSKECFMKAYGNQLSEADTNETLSKNNLYDSCRHHE